MSRREEERPGSSRTPIDGYTPKKKRRRLKRSVRRGLVLVVAVVMMLSLAWVITSVIQSMRGFDDMSYPSLPSVPSGNVNMASSLPNVPQNPLGSQLPHVDNTAWNTIGPVEQAAAVPILSPDRRMIALPENGRIDMAYFGTSVFVGDSITQGMYIYNTGIANANYCAYKGISPRQIYDGSLQNGRNGEEVPMDALVGYQPDNVYILLGANAMVGMDDEALLGYYSQMLDVMRERLHPEVNFYIQSITPVIQGRDARFDFDRINNLNDQLAKMAYEKGMYFLDLHEALAGDDGWLRPEFGGTRDAYHLSPAGYAAWVEYLVTHTAYNPRHAHLYLEGSHYYSQTPPPNAEG